MRAVLGLLVAAKVLDTNMRKSSDAVGKVAVAKNSAPGDPGNDDMMYAVIPALKGEFEGAAKQIQTELTGMLSTDNAVMQQHVAAQTGSAKQLADEMAREQKTLQASVDTNVQNLRQQISDAKQEGNTAILQQQQQSEMLAATVIEIKNAVQNANQEISSQELELKNEAQMIPVSIEQATEAAGEHADRITTQVQGEFQQNTAEIHTHMASEVARLAMKQKEVEQRTNSEVTKAGRETSEILAKAESMMNQKLDETGQKVTGIQKSIQDTGTKLADALTALQGVDTATNKLIRDKTSGLQGDMESSAGVLNTEMDALELKFRNVVGDMTTTVLQEAASSYRTAADHSTSEVKDQRDAITDMEDRLGQKAADVTNKINEFKELAEGIEKQDAATDLTVSKLGEDMAADEKSQKDAIKLLETNQNTKLGDAEEEQKRMILDLQNSTKTDIEKALSEITTRLTAAKEEIMNRINGNVSAMQTQGALLQTSTDKASQKAEALLADLRAVAADLKAEKAEVAAEVPRTTKVLQDSYSDVSTKIDTVGKQLGESRDKVLSVLEATAAQIDAQTQESMHGAEDHVRGQLQESSATVEKSIRGLMEQISGLKAGSERDYAQTRNAQADLHDQLQQGVQRAVQISKRSEEQGSTLKTKISEAIELMKTADSNTAHDSQQLQQQLQEHMHAEVNGASEDAGRKIKKAMDAQNAALAGFEQKAAKELASDASLLQQYSQSSTAKLAEVSNSVKKLGFDLQKTELAAEGKNSDLIAQTRSLAAQQQDIASKADRTQQVERAMIAKRTAALEKLVKDKVSAVGSADEAQIEDLRRQTAESFNEEKARQELEKNKVDETVKRWQDKLGSELAQVGTGVKTAERGLKVFEDAETGAESAFQQEIAKLDKAISESEDRVDATIKQQDQHVSGIMQGELGNMRALVDTFAQTQADAEHKVAELKQTFGKQLGFVQEQSKTKSADLASKLQHVEDRAADLVGEFRQDAQASQTELHATQGRLDKVVNSTMESMERFHQQLDQVQKTRTSDTQKLRSDIAGVKASLTQTMQHTGAKIEQMQQDTEQAYKSMSDKQQEFDSTLLEASSDAAKKDEGELTAVQQRMDTLEQDHSRLGEWQRSFKHRTLAWREAVERRLGQLTGAAAQPASTADSPEASSFVEIADTSSESAAQLQQENEALRALNAELLAENKHLYDEDAKLNARVAALEGWCHGNAPAP